MAYKKISIASLLSISLLLSACALFEDDLIAQAPPTEREQMFLQAEDLFQKKEYEAAKLLYFRLSRNVTGENDRIYDQSLWRLVKIYENNDESEKALLTLDELSMRKTSTISKNKIKFAQMKNNFRVTNFYQAQLNKKDLDVAYKNNRLSLQEIYDYLIEATALNYDHHLIEELMFLGEMQKYFVFVMESPLTPQNEQLTDHLIKSYEYFFSALKRTNISADFKKKLSITLLDQLQKFDQFKIDNTSTPTLTRFLTYSEAQQKTLIESFRK